MKNNNQKKHSSKVYEIYNYLKENAVGYENRKLSYEIMKQFEIKTNVELRHYIQEIRNSETLQKIICSEASQNGGYWVATNYEEVEATLKQLYKRAMNMLKTYSVIKNKAKLNNQLRMKFTKYEKDIYESIMKEDEN